MLAITRDLVARLDARGVRYCHWKSNARLAASVAGETDADLLVDPASRAGFEEVLAGLGFIALADRAPDGRTRHYFGFDEATGALLHLDVLSEIVTGGTLVKSHRLPLEAMVWEGLRRLDGVPVPSAASELALLLVRKTLECGSMLEHPFMRREDAALQEEISWLTEDPATLPAALDLLARWLPAIPPGQRDALLPALRARDWRAQRPAGLRLVRTLRRYRRGNVVSLTVRRGWAFAEALVRRFVHRRPALSLARPAPLIAFVGPKASGKSTLIEETRRWLGRDFAVRAVHAGQPPSTPLSWLPNRLLPLARRLLPGYRPSLVTPDERREMPARRTPGSVALVARSLLLAGDKRTLLARATRWRRSGVIVLCDRYPLPGPDGPLLDADDLEARGLGIEARAARAEAALLAAAPRPHILVSLHVTLDASIERNEGRRGIKPDADPEEVIRLRHDERSDTARAKTVIEIDTSGDLSSTILALRRALWDALRMAGGAIHRPDALAPPLLSYDDRAP